MGRAPSLGVFFWFFSLCRAEKVDWTSLTSRSRRKLLKPFHKSYNFFKDHFFHVTLGLDWLVTYRSLSLRVPWTSLDWPAIFGCHVWDPKSVRLREVHIQQKENGEDGPPRPNVAT
ncbi:hypothetical protein CR513_25652, partial [Mucuna pruriens]